MINIKVILIVNLEIFLDLPSQKINSSVVKFAIIRKLFHCSASNLLPVIKKNQISKQQEKTVIKLFEVHSGRDKASREVAVIK